MKKLKFLFFISILSSLSAQAQSKSAYKYSLDLTKISDDRIRVSLDVPDLSKAKGSKIKFFIPKIVPGTYAIYDYGKFVDDFKAFDKKGKEMTVSHPDKNTWTIKCPKDLAKISYAVNDSWDADAETMKPLPFEPAGSNIEADKNVVLNTHSFFGYFEGMTKLPYEVNITKPTDFFGATSLKRANSTKETDNFVADNYNYLADAPIMYCKPDTAMLDVNGSQILISVYSPTGKVKAGFVASQLKPTLNAQRQYLGGKLPVKNYAFIIYLTDGFTKTGSYGALEHSYSSFYVLPEMEPENIAQTVRDVAAHEFFHIVTPLSIHSKEIQDFDFINPSMSKHLWLYEGTTEYKASHVQVKYGMMPLEQYVSVLGDKIRESLTTKTKDGKLKYDDRLPFTEMSANVLGKYKEQYNNVYAKGTLIGACLDIMLNKNSKGQYNLNNLMADLAKEYGTDKAFDDGDLFEKIIAFAKMPDLKAFFATYVAGPSPLPLKETFNSVGIDFYPKKMVKETTIGGLDKALGFDMGNGFFIKDIDALDEFGKSIGFQKDDGIKAWDGKEITMETVDQTLGSFFNAAKPNQAFTVTILREGKEKTLNAKVLQVGVEKEYVLELSPNPTAEQLQLRKWWLGDQVKTEAELKK